MSQPSFFFYDLETSGLSPAYQRIMQFAGQRTDSNLDPIGKPINFLVRLSEDILPEPEAILITKTTPQQTIQEGISEPELAKVMMEQACTPGTTMVGFNNIRFDDEFVRHTLWRNFYDPYEWCYKDGRSRWDMLDVVRMTRALRPKGINWPVDAEGQPTNRLEELSKANQLAHDHAHDAMSDVMATIELARLIKQKQPKLFDYLLAMRSKNKVSELVNLKTPQAFVYSSGRYGKQKSFTTIGFPIAPGSRDGAIAVYDLSVDPSPFFKLNTKQLQERLFATREQRQKPGFIGLPVKELFYNKSPAVAPLAVMDDASYARLQLDKKTIQTHLSLLQKQPDFSRKLTEVYRQKPAYAPRDDIEGQLYDSFTNDQDKPRMAVIRVADEKTLATFTPRFKDQRLEHLFVRYKARHFPKTLREDERETWEDYRAQKLAKNGPRFLESLQKLALRYAHNDDAGFIIEELRLWFEAIAPVD
jgi:exodeoxyribonuclease-1